MLILSRHKHEVIRIGDDIKITFINMKYGQVTIGIDAPRNVTVHRQEIYKLIKKKEKESLEINVTKK